jgi:hypothetical protein
MLMQQRRRRTPQIVNRERRHVLAAQRDFQRTIHRVVRERLVERPAPRQHQIAAARQ